MPCNENKDKLKNLKTKQGCWSDKIQSIDRFVFIRPNNHITIIMHMYLLHRVDIRTLRALDKLLINCDSQGITRYETFYFVTLKIKKEKKIKM